MGEASLTVARAVHPACGGGNMAGLIGLLHAGFVSNEGGTHADPAGSSTIGGAAVVPSLFTRSAPTGIIPRPGGRTGAALVARAMRHWSEQ